MADVKDMQDFGKFGICSPHNFNYKVFEENMIFVLKEICKEYSNKKRLEEIAKNSKSEKEKELELQNNLKFYRNQIENDTKKLELLYEDRLSGIITVEKYIENSNKIKKQIEQYNERIKEVNQKLTNQEKVEDKNEKLNNVVNEFLNMEKPNKEIIREFIEKIEIHHNKQVDIYFNFKPLEEISKNLEKIVSAKKNYEW